MRDKVNLSLKEVVTPSESEERNEDAMMAETIVDATIKAFSTIGIPVQAGIEIPDLVINLNPSEFLELGRPSVGDLFRIVIKKVEPEL